jgi:hypothetical protein
LRAIRGSRSLFCKGGNPIEIEFTKITLFPARAKRRIKWFFECGWWYHQSSPAKHMMEAFRSIVLDSTIPREFGISYA